MSRSITLSTLTVLPLLATMQEVVHGQGRLFLWPKCIVKYRYDPGVTYSADPNLGNFMFYIESKTAVRFLMWREGDTGDYVTFDNGNHVPDKCGHSNGTYRINLSKDGYSPYHMLRNFLRVLGFLEEQNFHNRDMYFSFRSTSLIEDLSDPDTTDQECSSFFAKCPNYPPEPDLHPSFSSVMLNLDHRCNALEPGGMIILRNTSSDPTFRYESPVRGRVDISEDDLAQVVERIEILYPMMKCMDQRKLDKLIKWFFRS